MNAEITYLQQEEQCSHNVVHNAAPTRAPLPAGIDPSMLLSEDELRWTTELKNTLTKSGELPNNMTDMEYAHHAIIARGNLDEALIRIERIQVFREAYQVDNTLEQGMYFIQELLKQQPGFLLNIDMDLARNESINAFDFGCFDPNVALDFTASPTSGIKDNWRVFVCAMYYIKYLSQPSLAVIRNGLLELNDYGDYRDCGGNSSTETNGRLLEELIAWYPTKWNGCLMYNTGYEANIVLNTTARFMPKSQRQAMQLGCQVTEDDGSRNPHRRLREFYFQPSRAEVERNLLQRAKLLLASRRHNEQTYRLV